ncbi:uncharacterized protein BX664DRAFT_328015 [Halteromyces radiatus]|uniref:uncharacterized protein n=1 Tax=Halteromyces radiatus TaxID=101107 RepID=UPI00221E51F7|nr:uncharacterized protein BX664DRAFT_328015 [Halteromyces radiatus]KAI8092735.1 hypothetical protein BX664DRAFT_328015 [Halteromyces radiatus]
MNLITCQHIKEFQTQGYTILREALSPSELNMLHDEADMLSNYLMSEGIDLLRELGGIIEPLECGYLDPSDTKYKTNQAAYCERRDQLTPGVAGFLTTSVGQWAASLLYGTTINKDQPIYLLNEQYIIKPPNTKSISAFAWHRDSDYYKDTSLRNEITVACWMALDEVNEENGTLMIGSTVEKVQEIIQLPAGSIVFMSSHLLHKSTGNASSRFRRAFMPQYAKRSMLDPDSGLPIALAIPLSP